ncbi:hypothetical protein LB557_02080 [Mesorhizobium sp. BR115XR7A]|uniref:hypothetical protein n=1 Tax=Mesorhizobium sp. BR115XR7A TaxID=2876645 RepID=UPI001CC9B48A|nr:hypothetical protein [Mesorhizobium sp. BR115XR7A]MBZ9904796.1 hypothetical protein [Mesorhizobium sp. BR115XR7A]MBZ9933021.1 hypothetical protein [Mesorhizobium sp. BR1-1-5]
MQILRITREPPGGSGNTLARFDIALNDDIRLFGLRITERSAGGYSVYGPNAHGTRIVTFSYELVDQMARAALAALEEQKPNDKSAA